MQANLNKWDYLIVTASNDAQGQAYESQLEVRRELGLLGDVRCVKVVADPGGKRVGSGGSTICCLMEVLQDELGDEVNSGVDRWREVLSGLRILIIHAGGDSKRLPAYGSCGKIFLPVPGESDSGICHSLFDRQLPIYMGLPESVDGSGQVVIASGDVLLRFDPGQVEQMGEGVTGLACYALPEQGFGHGVFCGGQDDEVRLFLQKPSLAEQRQEGAVGPYGHICLDIGVMSFGASMCVKLLEVFGVQAGRDGQLAWSGEMGEAITECGFDFYRELCCAMGKEASSQMHLRSAGESGSTWDESLLRKLFDEFCQIPFNMRLLKQCNFLDFGTTRLIVDNGMRLFEEDAAPGHRQKYLDINNQIEPGGWVNGIRSWVEGCRISSELDLGGENVVVGVDIDKKVSLPRGSCLDVISGAGRDGSDVWFVRCYNIDDAFKNSAGKESSFCRMGVNEWLTAVGAEPEDVWDKQIRTEERSLWNGRFFPAEKKPTGYHRWLWMLDAASGSAGDFAAWRAAERYSFAEMSSLAGQDEFFRRREDIRAGLIYSAIRQMFSPKSGFSASELGHLLKNAMDPGIWAAAIICEAHKWAENGSSGGMDSLVFSRIIHTLGSALEGVCDKNEPVSKIFDGAKKRLSKTEHDWLRSIGLGFGRGVLVGQWAQRAREIAFEALGRTIISSGTESADQPRSFLRSDEIVWARVPARLDIGGGWTDTPPYSLEHGGCVVNVAVDLNGQPPIQAYGRMTDDPVIRINSIDLGARIEVTSFDELMDYEQVGSDFALAKAAFALAGLSPEAGSFREDASLEEVLRKFGGGIELTTLAAIPKGSGLGTSSIMGAVVIAAIRQIMGKTLTQRELFHSVLCLEQALTTGGGWQDQVGGVVDGVKIITTEAELVPDAKIHHLPSEVLSPKANGGCTLLYYTGITRLAKNILQEVVGQYLDRDRAAMRTLRQIHLVAEHVAEALMRKDIAEFGRLVDVAWELNKQLDPNCSNDEIEQLMGRVRPYIYGAKLPGAGGGGFLFMVCRSPEAALSVKAMLEAEPPNERARFFDFDISDEGLVVTVC